MKKICISFFVACLICFQARAQDIAPFKTGDRVVFLGNSITEAGFYESYIWLYYMTRFPNQRITIYNAGIGGDVVGQMNKRFESDVLPKKPDIVVLTFGMNDSGYFEFNASDAEETAKQRIQKSREDFQRIQEKLKAQPQVKKVIMSSSPYDETVKNEDNYFPGKIKAMQQIVAFQKKAALENNWAFVDLFHPMSRINLRGQENDPEFTLTGPDRIHPGKAGHLVMAALFLKEQGLAGRPVADITIDVKKGVLHAENAQVKLRNRSTSAIAFDYKSNALPFPVDSVSSTWGNPQKQSDALACYPFIEEFNREMLTVKNLKKGKYDLLIDGKRITTIGADSLARGINLALISHTPQYQQALTVMHLNDLRNDLEKKMREYYWLQFNYFQPKDMLFEDTQEAFDKVTEKARTDGFVRSKMETYQTARLPEVRAMWERNIKLLTDEIYEINKPENRLIEIIAERKH